MVRSRVDLPEPERPSRATISPARNCKVMSSRTRSSSPAAPVKLLLTFSTPTITSPAPSGVCVVMGTSRTRRDQAGFQPGSGQRVAAFGQGVEAAPEQPVESDDVEAHHRDADE